MYRLLSTYLLRRVKLTDEVPRAGELKELLAAPVRVVPDKRAELDGVPIVDIVDCNDVGIAVGPGPSEVEAPRVLRPKVLVLPRLPRRDVGRAQPGWACLRRS